MLQYFQRAKVTLTVRVQGVPCIVDRDTFAYRRQRVLQNPARSPMHVYIAASDERQFESTANLPQSPELLALSSIGKQFDRNPQSIAEGLTYPVILDIKLTVLIGYPKNDATRQTTLERQS